MSSPPDRLPFSRVERRRAAFRRRDGGDARRPL